MVADSAGFDPVDAWGETGAFLSRSESNDPLVFPERVSELPICDGRISVRTQRLAPYLAPSSMVIPVPSGDLQVVGRSPECDVVVSHPAVSKQHLELRSPASQLGRWRVRDLGSKNGTFMGKDRIGPEPVDLRYGSELRIGGLEVLFLGTRNLKRAIDYARKQWGMFFPSREAVRKELLETQISKRV
jgi:hypothetical protein